MNILKSLTVMALATSLFTGCATINEHSTEHDARSKEFPDPSAGKAGIYVYRDTSFFDFLKSGAVGINLVYARAIKIDGECIGELDNGYFFHEEVTAGVEHTISTASEFGYNDLKITPKEGENYYIAQSLKVGVTVAGSELKEVKEDDAKDTIHKSKLAKHGECSSFQ